MYPSVLPVVRNMTVAVTQDQLFSDTDAPWNAMMAAATIYVLPPIALLFALHRWITAGLRESNPGICDAGGGPITVARDEPLKSD